MHLEVQERIRTRVEHVRELASLEQAARRRGRDDSRWRWRTQALHGALRRLGVKYRRVGYKRTFASHVEALIGRSSYRDGGNRGVSTWPRSALQKLLKDPNEGPAIVALAREVRERGRGSLDLILTPGVPALPRSDDQRRIARRRHYDKRFARIQRTQEEDPASGYLLCLREAFDRIARRVEHLGRLPTQRAEIIRIDPGELTKDGWLPNEIPFWEQLVRRGEARRRVLDDGRVDYVLNRRAFLPYFSTDERALRVTRLLLGRSWSPPGALARGA